MSDSRPRHGTWKRPPGKPRPNAPKFRPPPPCGASAAGDAAVACTTEDERQGLCGTCAECGAKMECAGTGDQTRKRIALLLYEECPRRAGGR